MIVIGIKGEFPEVFSSKGWAPQTLPDYHIPFQVDLSLTPGDPSEFIENIRDSVHHAGLHLVGSTSPLTSEVKQKLIDVRLSNQIGIT